MCHARDPSVGGQQPMVLKKIALDSMSEDERVASLREVSLLRSLTHPCIVAYIDHFFDNETLCIVMEYCAAGDLSMKIRQAQELHQKFSEYDILTWFSQIVLALQNCHRQHVLHRDLKTQNIYLTDSLVVKLGDFGIARLLESTSELATSVVGTPYTMSPEVCARVDSGLHESRLVFSPRDRAPRFGAQVCNSAPYSYKSDVWALGCVLFEMCELTHAFNASNLLGLVWKIVQVRRLASELMSY